MGDIGSVKKALTPSFRKAKSSSPKKHIRHLGAFEDTAFKPGFEIVKI
jgi:hypothetical protein